MPPAAGFLHSLIDYAGLFPPASLPMHEAVPNHDLYRRGPDAWMLGRFVLGSAHAEAFRMALESVSPSPEIGPWRVAVVVGPDVDRDRDVIQALRSDLAGRVEIDALECAPATSGQVAATLNQLPDASSRYVELPLGEDPEPWLDAIHRAGAFAKIRTGSVVAEGIPDPAALLRFLRAAVVLGVPFKATAGLHHPVRGPHPLIYSPEGPIAVMHGYLNLITAVALLHEGALDATVREALLETDPAAFQIDGPSLAWRRRWIHAPAVAEARERSLQAIGSCSFREPVDALAEFRR